MILTSNLGPTATSWEQPRHKDSQCAGLAVPGVWARAQLRYLSPRGTCWAMPSFGAEDLEYGYDNKKVFLPRSITALHFFFVLPSPTCFLEFLKLVLTREWEHQQILMLPALPGTSDKRKPRESGTCCTGAGDCHIDNY